MDRLKQIIERLNAYIERLGIPIFALFIFVVAILILVVVWHYNAELAKFLGYLIGGVLVIWQISVASRRAAAAEKTAELTERGNIAERFKNAIEHLGNESAIAHLGGIYALHYIAQEVEDYRKRVFEILCAHIRETTTKDGYKTLKQTSREYIKRKQPTIQIQSILNLLFIEAKGREIYKEFRGDVKSANSCEANLQNADLSDANLQDAILWRTNLQNADLQRAKLQNADLWRANLQNTDLWRADLQNAKLWGTNLQNADLRNVDLTDAKNLEVKQLLEVKTLYEAKLSDEMKEQIMQKKPELFDPPDIEQES